MHPARCLPCCWLRQRPLCSCAGPARSPNSNQDDEHEEESGEEDDGFEGLTPEEDYTVPGGYMDSMSSNTQLGRAVQAACEELEQLGKLVRAAAPCARPEGRGGAGGQCGRVEYT